ALFDDKRRLEKDKLAALDLQNGSDTELQQMAEQELDELDKKIATNHDALLEALTPQDPNNERDVIMEIRAAAGGDESALFAGELYRMYARWAENHDYKIELLSESPSEAGGFKEIIFSVRGEDAYKNLKFEAGVHFVQRVPVTESQGRVHTSTATVAVLPEAEEADIEINPSDLRIDVYRSSGHGGQSVNTTDSAVRITHLPTGIVVSCQNERSQLQNRARAMEVLRSRLQALAEEEAAAKASADRRSQVRTVDRSERIRTYNFPENRISDHRIGYKAYNLSAVLDGDLGDVLTALAAAERAEAVPGS